MQIKKRHSVNPELQVKNLNGQYKSVCKSQHMIVTKDILPSPIKLIRKQGRHTQSFINTHQSLHICNNPTYQLIQQCIAAAEMIKEKHKTKTTHKFFHIRSCSVPCPKIQAINQLFDSLLDDADSQNIKEQKNLEQIKMLILRVEIQTVMNQLIEEKKQKQKAISQGESLFKQQDLSIQYLKSRIQQYKQLV
ncbi:unnamed protein product (macronuclear) [Paramecium tetraurelia]|uniref:Uncharacterized protein n=1 Tax=Paramecium tetraurelia TaxID=5888 RepID=A0BG86_PARTE|nr:uncharacterized protein GSPATT00028588001 [Paramecium tetraurelia]CAK57553.1 unnamed protein product [Paramecium tetraurelia]|eukprot:XP_001424951.1 hypothetical protein (macronuclear) [Paramecium tetraurelia strain d4-2]